MAHCSLRVEFQIYSLNKTFFLNFKKFYNFNLEKEIDVGSKKCEK